MQSLVTNKIVSVIIPTYSRPDYIVRAVKSVLCQTYKPIELIVVDDNGEGTPFQKETERLLSPYIIANKLIYKKHDVNRNGSAARNTGIRVSKGEFVTFLDDDDVLLPTKIEKQVNAIIENQNYDISYTGFRILSENKELKRVIPNAKGNLQYKLLTCRWSIGTGSNPMFSRRVFEKTGLFDEKFQRHQDIEFLVRVFRDFKIMPVNEILIERHIDSRINSVNYAKLMAVKNIFLETFKSDIGKYTVLQQNIIYRNQYADVACHAMQAKAYKMAYQYYCKAASYKILSFRILAKAIAYGFLGFKAE